MNRKYLKLYSWGAAFAAVFALSHARPLADVLAVFDRGRGAGFILGGPGQTVAPPSWVFRYAWLLAAAFCFAPGAAPLGRAALRFAASCRRELGDWWVAGIAAFAAAAAAACFAHFSLGGEGHSWEERELAFQARIFAAGRLTAPAPPTDEYVTPDGGGAANFVVGPNEGMRDGRWFTIFMPAWPLLLAAGTALGRPWLVNPAVGLLTAFALYGYGRRVVGPDAALVGVFFYTFSPFAAFNNASLFAEPTFLLFLVLFLWAFDAGRETGKASLEAAAGILLVVVFAIRDYAAFAALPAVALLFHDVARKKIASDALSYFALGVAVAAVPLLYYNYATAGAFLRFPRSYALHTRFGISPPSLSPYFMYFTTRRLWIFATDLMGWPLMSFVPALVPLFLRKLPVRARLLYVVAAATLILYVLPDAEGINYGARYYYGAVPAALLGGGLGLTLVPSWLKNKWHVARGTTAAAALLAVVVATVPYVVALEPVYRSSWGFPGGKRPWVSRGLERALEEYNVKEAIVFVAPGERCAGPPPNGPALKDYIVYAHDRGERNAAFAALFLPRPYLLCDYREFEETGVIGVLELEPEYDAAPRRMK
ncbi:MAG: hypothetical protein GTN49_10165 [candidate division Zixibacteria bacterium]|nr:hypothetical protein [candidate division Zixibacteria bacterium]